MANKRRRLAVMLCPCGGGGPDVYFVEHFNNTFMFTKTDLGPDVTCFECNDSTHYEVYVEGDYSHLRVGDLIVIEETDTPVRLIGGANYWKVVTDE